MTFNECLAEIDALAAENAELRRACEWQSIVGAPACIKDGRDIVAKNADGIVSVIGWRPGSAARPQWQRYNHVPIYGWIRRTSLRDWAVEGFEPACYLEVPLASKGAPEP